MSWITNLNILCRLSHPRDPPAPIRLLRKNYFPIGTDRKRRSPAAWEARMWKRCCVDLSFHSSHIYRPISGLPVRIFQIGCAIVLARCDTHTDPLSQLTPLLQTRPVGRFWPSEPLRDLTESDPLWHGEPCVLAVDHLTIALALAD